MFIYRGIFYTIVSVSEEGQAVPERKIIYRITNEEYETMTRIADMLFKAGKLKINSANALGKAAAFTQINIYLQIEAKEHAFEERQKEIDLQQRNAPKNVRYAPNIGSY